MPAQLQRKLWKLITKLQLSTHFQLAMANKLSSIMCLGHGQAHDNHHPNLTPAQPLTWVWPHGAPRGAPPVGVLADLHLPAKH